MGTSTLTPKPYHSLTGNKQSIFILFKGGGMVIKESF
jgi:hypothetical protein